MKHKLSFTIALWWIILCAVAGLFLLVATDKDSRPSESENRMLAGFPEVSARSVASGEFMAGFDSFLTDGFFARDGVVSFTGRLLDGFSLLAIEFKKNTTGFVKQVKGQVFEEYEKYIGNIKVVEKHPITVVWRHTGACYNNRHARMEQFDVTQYLEQ